MFGGAVFCWSRMLRLALLCWVVIVCFLLHPAAPIKWLAISKHADQQWNQTRRCSEARRSGGFMKRQVRMCKDNIELMDVIVGATHQATRACQMLFSDRRWNCSSVVYSPDYLADLTGGSREQAFVYALSSATLTQAVSRACSLGVTTKCGCGRLPRETPTAEFKWGGCGDNSQFGTSFSRSFTDDAFSSGKQKNRVTKRNTMNLHNYEAGRQVALGSMKKMCKCHGVSGSCSIKTCWMGLASVEEIGKQLLRKYAVAIEVENRRVNKKRSLAPIGHGRSTVTPQDLIYFTKSSDYCLPDTSLGSLGTYGRTCDPESTSSGGCRSMCCGRGYTSITVEERQRCECKYYWCCYVKCKTCIRQVTINRCR